MRFGLNDTRRIGLHEGSVYRRTMKRNKVHPYEWGCRGDTPTNRPLLIPVALSNTWLSPTHQALSRAYVTLSHANDNATWASRFLISLCEYNIL